MRSGRLIDLFYDDHTYVFARQLGSETVIIAINRQDEARQVTIPAGSIGLKDGVALRQVLPSGRLVQVTNGSAILNLLPKTAVAFKAH